VSADVVSRRVLAGVRPLDAVTGERLLGRVEAEAPGVRWVRNRGGDLVAVGAAGLAAHADAPGLPPAEPPLGSAVVTVTMRDPARVYLTRLVRVALPRDHAPGGADEPDSLFQPVPCPMFRGPAAPVGPNWAVLRVRVADEAGDGVLAGALLRLVRAADDVLLGGGLTDDRGEALVAAAGIPVTTWGESADDDVIVTEVAARLEVVHDPDAAVPDPGDLEDRRADLLVRSADVTLASGRHEPISL
jgi:hypothetical protein